MKAKEGRKRGRHRGIEGGGGVFCLCFCFQSTVKCYEYVFCFPQPVQYEIGVDATHSTGNNVIDVSYKSGLFDQGKPDHHIFVYVCKDITAERL